ncbi:hypothetical protein HDU98_002275 [Podochytrium sp. JEL0797]|nr:hypothetical protein HDU98_002275 [Podochytrium sp. JEL0797]
MPDIPERINATDRVYIFNTAVEAPESVSPGTKVKGAVTFDTTSAIKHMVIHSIIVKLECQEYRVTPPNADHSVPSGDSSSAPKPRRRGSFSEFFQKHGAAPMLSHKKTSAYGAVNEVEHLPVETKSDITFSILPQNLVDTELAPGKHVYPFEVDLPRDWPVVSAADDKHGDVLMLISRLHGIVEVEGVKDECFSFLHVVEPF